MAGLCMIVNVIESENKQITHVSKQKIKPKKTKHVQCIINNNRRNGIHVNSPSSSRGKGLKHKKMFFSTWWW